jgi:GNAT superfamily N-acetyltransferase
MCELTELTPLTASRYAGLTFSGYRSAMEWFDGRGGWVGLGAAVDSEPVGLALARQPRAGLARIASVFVAESFRRRGIATRLLGRLEELLVERELLAVDLVYAPEAAGAAAFEALLRRRGWPDRGDRIHVFIVDGRIMSAPWFDGAVLPPSYEICDWASLREDERQGLARSQETERWIPEVLNPFDHEKNLEPLNSLALRHEGRVEGWLLTQPMDASTLHYASVYVRPSVNRAGSTFASLALLAEAVRRQERALGIASRGRFEVLETNRPFLRFIERRLVPYLCSRETLQRLVKRLRA